MQHDARRYGRHTTLLRGFLDGKSLQLHILYQSSLPVGQTLQQSVQIGAQRALFGIFGRKEGAGILEGDLNRPVAAAQMIDQLVAAEGICPRREGKRSVVAVALQMHCQECLLDEILDFRGRADATGEVTPEVATEEAEELTVRARVSFQAADHQRPEALFGLVLLQHWRIDSLAARERRHFSAGGPQSTNRETLNAV